MNKIATALIVFSSFISFSCAEENTKMNELQTTEFWFTDYKESLKIAKQEKKKTLMYFGGSTWCPPCILLDSEVFESKDFKTYASENLVLVNIDFPRNRKQSKKLRRQNAELATRYGIYSFPTVLLLNETGKVIDSLVGYSSQYKDSYVKFYRK